MTEPAAPPETFDFGDSAGYEHRISDGSCDQGWCGCQSYPKTCEQPGCTGLVHANFGDESWDSYWLHTRCDVCGEEEA